MCANDVRQHYAEKIRTHVQWMQCHAIIDVVIDVRVVECHASMDVVIGVLVVLCHQAIDNSGFSTFLNFPLRVQILNLLSYCSNSSSLFPVAFCAHVLHRGNISFEVWYLHDLNVMTFEFSSVSPRNT